MTSNKLKFVASKFKYWKHLWTSIIRILSKGWRLCFNNYKLFGLVIKQTECLKEICFKRT